MFDKVSHHLLLNKFSSLKINKFLLRWISDYLTDRKQSVIIGGAQSSVLPVISGVPHGSILGPLLFVSQLQPQVAS